jgi:hypothetical protein
MGTLDMFIQNYLTFTDKKLSDVLVTCKHARMKSYQRVMVCGLT